MNTVEEILETYKKLSTIDKYKVAKRILNIENESKNGFDTKNMRSELKEVCHNQCCCNFCPIKEKYGTIDVLVNNAGFGTCGQFVETELEKELKMIDTNICAVHILTKLFLIDMVKENKGYIMNVASIAGFMPGPLMATYYSSKAYVVRLTQSIKYELKKMNSNVKISALCPGPVKTNFSKVANVKFSLKEADSKQVARYGVNKMFKNRTLIFPSFTIWLARVGVKIAPDGLVSSFCYRAQKRKIG